MEEAETKALAKAITKSYQVVEEDQKLTTQFICDLHRSWLDEIYDFAGQYRSVDVRKGNLLFCHAAYIPEQMNLFEQRYLGTLTPCRGLELKQLCENVAKVHSELILIHPFREGNGRLARWVSNIMVAQAGFATISYDNLTTRQDIKEAYFSAIRKSIVNESSELSQLFEEWVMNSSENRGGPVH
jgi:cell filamentation protein